MKDGNRARCAEYAGLPDRWKQAQPEQGGLEHISSVLQRVMAGLGIESPAETQLELLTPAA